MEKRNWIIWLSVISICLVVIVGYISYKDYKYAKVIEDHKKENDKQTSKSNFFIEFIKAHEEKGDAARMLCPEVKMIPFGLIKQTYIIEHNVDKNYHIEEITEWKDGNPLTKKWKFTVKENHGKLCINSITEVK